MTICTSSIMLITLDDDGHIRDPETDQPVRTAAVPDFLDSRLAIKDETTDVFIFVHGWRNSGERAMRTTSELAALLEKGYKLQPDRYPGLSRFMPQYIAICWPSNSNPFPPGYRRIRRRAYNMTDRGHAATVLAQLLGYLNAERRIPRKSSVLATSAGQYLHAIGHSFGGRMLGKAITKAADPPPNTLGWPWPDQNYPYTVDTLAVFQMAAQPTIFCQDLNALLTDAPINGPIALTFSKHDRALRFWHRIPEHGYQGIGYKGASCPAEVINTLSLLPLGQDYTRSEFLYRILNIDASWRYSAGRHLRPQGSHSDYLHLETAHLLLSLVGYSR